jgi:hypothetical protein
MPQPPTFASMLSSDAHKLTNNNAKLPGKVIMETWCSNDAHKFPDNDGKLSYHAHMLPNNVPKLPDNNANHIYLLKLSIIVMIIS